MTWENRLIFELSSADPDAAVPVWVNLSPRIRDGIQPMTLQTGRQNDLDAAEPARLDLLLDNSDDALTYGNTASPYPWWGPGRKCRLRETLVRDVRDTFTRNVAAGSWDAADSGQVWQGASSVWSVSGGQGRSTHAAGGVVTNTLAGTSGIADVTATVTIQIGQKLTGSGVMFPSLLLRQVDANNYYQVGLYYNSSATATAKVGVVIGKTVAGVGSNLFTDFTWDNYNGSEAYFVKAECAGTSVRVKVWRTTAAEPAAWMATVTDSSISAGSVGVLSSRDAGITNANPFAIWDDLTVQQSARFTGYLQVPSELLVTAGIEQRVSVTAVDRLGQLASGRPFISNLGAQIMASSNLVLYYPLNDASQPFLPAVGAGNMEIKNYVSGTAPYSVPTGMLALNSIAGPPGDEGRYPRFAPTYYDPPTPTAGTSAYPFGTANVNVHVGSGETIAVSAWMSPLQQIAALSGGLQDAFFLAITADAGAPASFGTHNIIFYDRPAGVATAYAYEGANNVAVTAATQYPREAWRLVTARLTIPSGVFTLWIGSDLVASGTLVGAPTAYDFRFFHIGNTYFGSLAHLQVRVGVDVFPYSEHLAQVAIGMGGLERQTTGDRIRTIAQYAGIPAAELGQIDQGTSVMQRASLAGKDPLTAMRDAERTEQGLLYVDGGGNLVFKDRNSLYNI